MFKNIANKFNVDPQILMSLLVAGLGNLNAMGDGYAVLAN
jgi:hypothetical protein